MKQLLLSATCVLYTLSGFSQDYKLDELKNYYWNVDSAIWQQEETQFYSYENGGIKETRIKGIDFLTSENYYQIKKFYNTNNDISSKVNQEWNSNLMDWDTYSEVTYDYDPSKKLISETTRLYDHNTMTYMNDSRIIYDYAGSLLIKKTIQEWDSDINDWINEDKSEMTYSAGLITKQISSYWNNLDDTWYQKYRDTMIYNASNLLIEWSNESYSYIDNVWELEDRTLISYTGLLQTELLNQSWNGSNWKDDIRQTNTFDANGNKTTFLQENWDANKEEWVFHYKEEMVYSLAELVGVNELITGNLKLYPNPVNDVLNLEFDSSLMANCEVQLLGMDGKLIHTEVLTNGTQKFQLHLSHLPKGMYLLTFKERQNFGYKFLKE